MSYTLEEMKEALRGLDELTLLETLELTSEELVELLEDQIIEYFDGLEQALSEKEEDE
jgi:hypothetical protein